NEIEIDNKPQLFILEEETGRGKTEAALTLAHRIMSKGLADGIYFALPTMATANAMFERVDKVYKKYYSETANPSFILAHSASKMYLQLERTINDTEIESNEDNINQDCPFWIADNRKKALLADVGVGTIDQALLAILQARHQALRLLGLSRKVLIVDEVHACDNYVHTLLRNLLKFHAAQGESAILLSATLPVNMRKELIESFAAGMELGYNGKPGNGYPLMTKCSASGYCEIPIEREKKSRKVKVKTTNRAEDVLAELKKVIESGRCACWVRNTVYDALEAYKNAQKVFNKENIILFHARFALGDRLDIETEILKKFGPNSVCNQRKGKLVIATQVVEQSLDIDFDFIVSDLAPIDLIIQRAGRLCRHNRDGAGNRIDNTDERGEPVMAVFMPVMDDKPKDDWYKNLFPKGSRVYQHQGQLWLTAKWLTAHGGITMPDDAREMVEYVYGEEGKKDIPEIFERGDNKADGNAKAAASMANFNGLKLEVGYMPDDVRWIEDDNAPTRLGEPTVLVRLAISENGKLVPLIRKGQGAGWELSQVSVYRKLLAFEDESKKQEISAAKEEMPDKGKYCLLIPLEKSSDGWSGKALNNQSQNVTIYYNNKTGLQIVKGEEDELD
ncbi:MAG: CRISPR-associated helicase Cas3', partial [Elusimicrobiota bacterium]